MRYVWMAALVLTLGCGDDDGSGGGDGGDPPPGRDGGSAGMDSARPPTGTGNDCADPDPAWLFCEDFEAGGGDFTSWFAASGFLTATGEDDRGRLDISDVSPHSGSYALYMPAEASSNYQGGAVGWVHCQGEQRTNCEPQDHEELYFRVWVRFAPDHRYVHHFLNIGGRDRFWGYGSAGCMPNGVSEMGTTVDHRTDTHESHFYSYHLDMSCDTRCDRYLNVAERCAGCDMRGFPTCDTQQQCCWGNHFEPDPPIPFPVDRWFCFELMMRANTPGEADGVQAYWIDDELALRVEGMRWRTTPELGLNYARVQHYIANGDADQSNRAWFDDVVVSTEPIGCDSF